MLALPGSGSFRDASAPRGVPTEHADGSIMASPPEADDRSLILFDQGDHITVQAGERGIRFLLVSGRPLQEPVAFAHDHLLPRLELSPVDESVAVHVTCSSTRMGLADKFVALAKACAREVVVPAEITCCGFAGDKGFTTPELNASALGGLAEQVAGCRVGYSNSRTCEIGLSQHGGIPYRSILSLLDRASRAKP